MLLQSKHGVSTLKPWYPWVDVAKGVGIGCVIIGHACTGPLHTLIYSFHMPLFFFLSGFVHSPTENVGESIKKRMMRLLIPYFLYSAIIIVVCGGFGRGWVDVFSLLGVTPTWFLSCLFITELIVILCENVGLNLIAVCGMSVGFTFVLHRCGESQFALWLGNVLMPALSFWCSGYLLKTCAIKKKRHVPYWVLIVICIGFLSGYVYPF